MSTPLSFSTFAVLDEALSTQDPQKLFFIINGDSPSMRSRIQQQRILTNQQQFIAAQTQSSMNITITNQPISLRTSLLLCVSRLVALVKTSVTHKKVDSAMRTSDIGLETHKQALSLLHASQSPGVSISSPVLSTSEFARLRKILTLSFVQLIEVQASWLEDATIFQKGIEQLQGFFKFTQGLDLDVYILYVRLLLRYSSSLLRHEASAALAIAGCTKKQVQGHQKASTTAKSNLDLTQHILKRGLAQGVAICIILVDEFCEDEHLGSVKTSVELQESLGTRVDHTKKSKASLLPFYDADNKISFKEAFYQVSNPQSLLENSPLCVAHVPQVHRQSIQRHLVCLYFAHVCWALLARGGSMEDVQSEFSKILRHLANGSGKMNPKEAQAMPCFSKSNLWELVFACFNTAIRDAPEPIAAAEIALSLHDATIEFITMHATSQPAEMKMKRSSQNHLVPLESSTNLIDVKVDEKCYTLSSIESSSKPALDMSLPVKSFETAINSAISCQSPSSPQNLLTTSTFTSLSHSLCDDPHNSYSTTGENSTTSSVITVVKGKDIEDLESVCSTPLRDVLRGIDNLFTSDTPSPLISISPLEVIDVSMSAQQQEEQKQEKQTQVHELIQEEQTQVHELIQTSCEGFLTTQLGQGSLSNLSDPIQNISRGLHFNTPEKSKTVSLQNNKSSTAAAAAATSTSSCGDDLSNVDWSYDSGAEFSSDEENVPVKMDEENITMNSSSSLVTSTSDPVLIHSILADFLIPPSNASIDTKSIIYRSPKLEERNQSGKRVERVQLPWLNSSDRLVECVRNNAENLEAAAVGLGMILVEGEIVEPGFCAITTHNPASLASTPILESSTILSSIVRKKRTTTEMSNDGHEDDLSIMTDSLRIDRLSTFSSQSYCSTRQDDQQSEGMEGNKKRRIPSDIKEEMIKNDQFSHVPTPFKASASQSLFFASSSSSSPIAPPNGLTPIRIPIVHELEMNTEDDLGIINGGIHTLSAETSPSSATSATVENSHQVVVPLTLDSSIQRASSLSSSSLSRKKDRQNVLVIKGVTSSRSLPLNVRWSEEVNVKEELRRRERLVSLEEDYDASLVAFSCRDASPRLRIHLPSPSIERLTLLSSSSSSSSSSPVPTNRTRSPSGDFERTPNPLIIPTASPLPQLLTNVDSCTASSWPVSIQGDLKFGLGPSMRCWPSHPPRHSPLSPAYAYHLFCHYHSLEKSSDATFEADNDQGELGEVRDLLQVAIRRAFSSGKKELGLMLSLKEKVTQI